MGTDGVPCVSEEDMELIDEAGGGYYVPHQKNEVVEMAPPKQKLEIISVSFPEGTRKKLQEIAKRYNITVSQIFRGLIGIVDFMPMVVPLQKDYLQPGKPSLSEFTDEELLEECQKRLRVIENT